MQFPTTAARCMRPMMPGVRTTTPAEESRPHPWRWRTLVMVVTSLWLMSHGQTTEAGEPQELLRQTLTGVLAVLTDDTLKAPAQSQARLERLAQVVAPSFDFKEMARRSLGHEWHRLTPAQQEEFVRFFSPLLLQSLVQRIAYRATTSATGYGSIPTTVHYQRETIDPDGDASVQTVMTYAHEQTTEAIEYLLLRRNGAWRVYDVIVEGASMVTNYRTQFATILRQESYDALITRLKTAQH
jgi:phospholipid transport system substrate-binding protein